MEPLLVRYLPKDAKLLQASQWVPRARCERLLHARVWMACARLYAPRWLGARVSPWQVGVGTSRLQLDMVKLGGYEQIVNLDISSVAVQHMQEQHSGMKQLTYRIGDCRWVWSKRHPRLYAMPGCRDTTPCSSCYHEAGWAGCARCLAAGACPSLLTLRWAACLTRWEGEAWWPSAALVLQAPVRHAALYVLPDHPDRVQPHPLTPRAACRAPWMPCCVAATEPRMLGACSARCPACCAPGPASCSSRTATRSPGWCTSSAQNWGGWSTCSSWASRCAQLLPPPPRWHAGRVACCCLVLQLLQLLHWHGRVVGPSAGQVGSGTPGAHPAGSMAAGPAGHHSYAGPLGSGGRARQTSHQRPLQHVGRRQHGGPGQGC